MKMKGQSAVEIALLLPILILILMGIIVFAFIFNANIQVSNAAREGARAGSLYRMTRVHQLNGNVYFDSLRDTVNWAIYDPRPTTPVNAFGNLPPKNYSVDIGYSGDENAPRSGDTVKVTLTYSYTMPVLSVMLPMIPNPIVIVRTVTMDVQ